MRLEYKKLQPSREKIISCQSAILRQDQILTNFKRKLQNPMRAGLFSGTCFITYRFQKDAVDVLEDWEIRFMGKVSAMYLPFLRKCYKGQANTIQG